VIINANLHSKVDAIVSRVRQLGQHSRPVLSSTDTWEYCGIRVMVSDGGYSQKLVTDKVNVWVEHGSGNSGWSLGGPQQIDRLLYELGIAAQ